jgi:hypothetical protein
MSSPEMRTELGDSTRWIMMEYDSPTDNDLEDNFWLIFSLYAFVRGK